MRSLTKALLGIIFVTSLAGAQAVTDSANARTWVVRYKPPAIYEQWWTEIATCEHLPLPKQHTEVLWLMVPVRPFRLVVDTTHTDLDGDALRQGDQEEILINFKGVVNELLIKHEQLHKLLFWWNGNKIPSPDHPAPYYDQCDMVRQGQQKP